MLAISPAFIKTVTWDVIAWNKAATVVLWDYASVPEGERNILRRMFCNPLARERQLDRESVARFVVAAFRADAIRAGASEAVKKLVDELSRGSPEFDAMWRENSVRSHGEGTKHLRHPAGLLGLEYSSFAVDGRPDLAMVIYNPATPQDADLIRSLIGANDSGTE